MKNVEDIYPLSPMQEGMLFQTISEPAARQYHEQIGFTFRGELDAASLRAAWEHIVERHAPLRTAFLWEGLPRPLQVVRQRVALPWSEEDWRALSAEAQAERLEALWRSDRERGFELPRAPLMRLALVRLEEGRHHLFWSHHHLLLDGWSIPLVLRELFELYRRLLRSEPLPSAAGRPFRDYIAWLEEQDLTRSEAFWRAQLAGLQAATPLPLDGIAPLEDGEERSDVARLAIPAAELAEVQARCRQIQITLGTLVQAAWALVLARYGRVDDVVFGSVTAGRPAQLEDVEGRVGMFVNTLPVRVRVPLRARASDWLRELQALQAELRQHEHCPLLKIQRWSDVPPGQPLFESLVAVENYPLLDVLAAGSEELRIVELRSSERTNYPLAVMALPGEGLSLQIVYHRRRYRAAAVEQMLGTLAALLKELPADPQRPLWAVSSLGTGERERLAGWSRTRASAPSDACVHHLFEAQARRAPEAIALTFQSESLTYRELSRRSSQLAHALRRRGVRPEVRVGLLAERSPEAVVALLGILKAGGAYVPLDPAQPPHRLRALLENADVDLVLSQPHLTSRLGSPAPPLLELGPGDSAWASEPTEAPDDGAHPDDLIYVMHTSGSTGEPKGVAVPHRAVVRLVRGASYLEATPDDVFLQLAPLSFDASVLELWGSLLNGARLVIAPPELPSLAEIAALLVRSKVSTLWLTAGLFHQMVDAHPEALAGLRHLLAGGDVLSPAHVRRLLAAPRAPRITNGYGPTENTTFTCCGSFQRAEEIGRTVPIGRPISGTEAYLLDEELQPVPLGALGELFTGGAGLARGYLGRPDLTAERFVPSPFAAGERLYRTGDLARYLPDGELEFAGRLDEQVKIRGYRIEPAEIEATLAKHPRVREAAVVARRGARGEARLVAYAAGSPAPPVEELRAFLEDRLPGYMVPAAFVRLDALPLTANGKVDRRALPIEEAPLRASSRPPATEVEGVLASLWSQVLGAERIGAGDNFFELGGHSLGAMQVASRIRDVWNVELPVRALFESPTLVGLAERIERARAGSGHPVPPLAPVPRDRPIPLTYSQERLWRFQQAEPDSTAYNVPLALRLLGKLDARALEAAFQALVQRHEALRTRFVELDGEPVQQVAPALEIALPVDELQGASEPEDEVQRRARAEALEPFQLASGPLLRARLLRVASEEHVLLLTLHHIVTDGWSVGVLFQELAALYEALVQGRPPALPELPFQYPDYAAWQRSWLRGEILEERLAYWRSQLSGAAVLELPVDRPRPPVRTFRGAHLPIRLPGELRDALVALSRREGATVFMTLMAALGALLGGRARQDEIVIGVPVANRGRRELEPLIGLFVNVIALRLPLGEARRFRELLRKVRGVTLDGYAHQDAPIDRVIGALPPLHRADRAPVFQVMFALQNAPMELRLPGLTLLPDRADLGDTSTYELALDLSEDAQGLTGDLEYNTDLFDTATVERLARAYQRLLRAVVDEPDLDLTTLLASAWVEG